MRAIAFCLLALLTAVPAQAVQDPNQPGNRMQQLQRQAMRFVGALRELGDWQQHYDYITDAAERVYERNNWTSEPDLFSLELLQEVGRIPPWEMQERFDTFLGMVGDRYLLNDDQKRNLQFMIARESFGIFSRNAPNIMQYSMEAVQTRARGEPFTPEQIARWTELATPVIQDVARRIEAGGEIFMQQLDPEQRALVRADLDATFGRLTTIEKMSERWRAGQWDASDWGLEDDPIQSQAVAQGALASAADPRRAALDPSRDRQAADAGQAPMPPGDAHPPSRTAADSRRGATDPGRDGVGPKRDRSDPSRDREGAGRVQSPADPAAAAAAGEGTAVGAQGPDDDWARYVRGFIARYNLNEEQQQRAWLLYGDATSRRETFVKRRERLAAEAAERHGAGTPAAAAEVAAQVQQHNRDEQRLFDQLKQRLDRLPTRAQRREAESARPAATRPARSP